MSGSSLSPGANTKLLKTTTPPTNGSSGRPTTGRTGWPAALSPTTPGGATSSGGADAQRPDLFTDRRPDPGRNHLAPGDPKRRTKLGLPLLLDQGFNLHPLGALHARFRLEANDFFYFIADVARGTDDLQIMYGVAGETELTENAPPPPRLRRRVPGPHRQRGV